MQNLKPLRLTWKRSGGYGSYQSCRPCRWIEYIVSGGRFEIRERGEIVMDGECYQMSDAKDRCQSHWNRFVKSLQYCAVQENE